MDEQRHGRGFVALVVLVTVLVAAIVMAVVLRATKDKPVVGIVGNSITVVSMPAFERSLANDYEIDVAAALGVQVGQMQDRAREIAGRRPAVAVIELGSNDVLQGADLDQSVAGIRQMADVFLDGGATCVHVVNVSTEMRRRDGTPTGDRARELNALTSEMADADDRIVVVDWAGTVLEAQQQGEDLTPDSAHPDEAGAEILAGLLVASLAEGCPAERAE
ncbi:MAG: hypothetical protein JJU45_14690 [Acidimicrobiia bacterium]|nr:hypothetical protein [Acidimicrobiia bacterium]